MAVLGSGGRLVLKRDAPDPCILLQSGLNGATNTFAEICPGYWSGDHISADCLPVVRPGEWPGNPEGWAAYQDSFWFVGPNRDHITGDADEFYKKASQGEQYPDGQYGDDAQFYARVGDVADGKDIVGCQDNDYWLHVDQLGQISFYEDRCAALKGCTSNRLELAQVAGEILVAPVGSVEYLNAVVSCYESLDEDYKFSDVADSVTLVSICADAPEYQLPEANPNTEAFSYDNADVLPRDGAGPAPYWQCIAELANWELNLQGAEIDTTGVAEKWGNSVKSVVNGGGTMEFFVDRKCFDRYTTNGLTLMQLLLMTEKGCKAEARFYMICRPGDCEGELCDERINGSLFYQADVLVTQTAVNVRPTDAVVGTANFVTTGEIRLLEMTGT